MTKPEFSGSKDDFSTNRIGNEENNVEAIDLPRDSCLETSINPFTAL